MKNISICCVLLAATESFKIIPYGQSRGGAGLALGGFDGSVGLFHGPHGLFGFEQSPVDQSSVKIKRWLSDFGVWAV